MTPASGCQDHTASPSASGAVVYGTLRVHRIPPHVFVTLRNAPLSGRDQITIVLVHIPVKRIFWKAENNLRNSESSRRRSPSGPHIWWVGMPIFTFEGTKVRDPFVLGDVQGLIGRLEG